MEELQELKTMTTELIKSGTDIKEIWTALSERIGNDITRLLIVNSALDLGMDKEEVKKYIDKF